MSTPPLDLELLQAFVAVADLRSFTRAATALNRTQSAVSTQIKRLEERLGVALFHRTTVSVDLSMAGEGLLGYARRILLMNDEAIDHVRGHRIHGSVRLGVMDDYGTLLVPGILARFAAGHPLVHVHMETGLTGTMVDRLGEAFDLVIAMHPAGAPAESPAGPGEGIFLRREQPVWATGASHPVLDISPLPLALYPSGCLFRKWAMAALDAAKIPWRLAFVSHSLAAVEAVAAQGLAVTVVKRGTFPARLRPLSERDGMPPLPAAEIRLHRAPGLSPAAALLADHLVASLAEKVAA
jgi:DNA-binding transcriptional LysR family regulator